MRQIHAYGLKPPHRTEHLLTRHIEDSDPPYKGELRARWLARGCVTLAQVSTAQVIVRRVSTIAMPTFCAMLVTSLNCRRATATSPAAIWSSLVFGRDLEFRRPSFRRRRRAQGYLSPAIRDLQFVSCTTV